MDCQVYQTGENDPMLYMTYYVVLLLWAVCIQGLILHW